MIDLTNWKSFFFLKRWINTSNNIGCCIAQTTYDSSYQQKPDLWMKCVTEVSKAKESCAQKYEGLKVSAQ